MADEHVTGRARGRGGVIMGAWRPLVALGAAHLWLWTAGGSGWLIDALGPSVSWQLALVVPLLIVIAVGITSGRMSKS